MGAASYVPAISLEKALFIRERNDGLYRPITYLLAKLFDEMFITLISSVVFAAIVFYVVKVRALISITNWECVKNHFCCVKPLQAVRFLSVHACVFQYCDIMKPWHSLAFTVVS